jgi:glycosyltransferase involved in cell wall biosynthesis
MTLSQHGVEAAEDAPGARSREPRISIVVPTLNEAENLREVLPSLPEVHEVILVDGGSLDGTVEVAHELVPGITTVRQLRRGKGNALAAGFARVTGDVVVMFDADGSADPAEIPRFVEALVGGADFAKGTRFGPGGGSADITAVRRLGNRFLHTWMNVSFGTRFTDLCYGYNAFWADLIPLLDLPDHELVTPAGAAMLWGDGFEIETLINCRFAGAGLRISEVPSVERPRLHGVSNLHAVSDGFRVLRTLRSERSRLRRSTALDQALLDPTPSAD